MKIRPAEAELFLADGQMDRHILRSEQSIFRTFANPPKKSRTSLDGLEKRKNLISRPIRM
jgi:hypothetical protein